MNTSESQWSQQTADDTNPYRAPGVGRPIPAAVVDSRKRPGWFLIAISVQVITILIGAVATLVYIESILVSGAVLSIIGIVVAMMSLRHKWGDLYVLTAIFGGSGPILSAGCFLLINLQDWGPSAATEPIGVIAVIYACSFLPLGAWVLYGGGVAVERRPVETGRNSANEPWV